MSRLLGVGICGQIHAQGYLGTMKVLNFGSINIDHVYKVSDFVRPGETLNCHDYQCFAGGKGLNQSIALAHAGGEVFHAGKIGKDDDWLRDRLHQHGVEVSFIELTKGPTGHAMIQVNASGENAIVIWGGANQRVVEKDVRRTVKYFSRGDYLLVQNEVSSVADIVRISKAQGLKIAFNPAPMTPQVLNYPLDLVDIFIINEIEAYELTKESDPEKISRVLGEQFPQAAAVLTLGERGAWYLDSDKTYYQPAEAVKPIDTTAAGDTFIGYFLAEFIETGDVKKALGKGCRAAAICVTRSGAADSIPRKEEVYDSRI